MLLKTKIQSHGIFFEDGNFTVNKPDVPFSAIGIDHGIEHENRATKVNGA